MCVDCLLDSIGHHLSHIYEAAGLPVQEYDFYKDYKLQSKSDSNPKLAKPVQLFVLNIDS